MNATFFFSGSRFVATGAQSSTALLNLCLQHGINYIDFQIDDDGGIRFRTSLLSAKRLARLCEASGVELRVIESRGLPHLLWRYRKRAGIMLGALLAVILVFLSERFVWDVRVTGNESMTESEVLAELKECGFGVGSYIPSVHAGELENRVLIASEKISWISIYLDGTVARVQIIEHTEAPPAEDLSSPANLVASCDGQIEVVELYRGNCVVKPGQAVKKGELLVSGLYDSNLYGYRYTRAAGKVLARTERTFHIEIPLSYEEKVYEEAKCGEIVLNFFDFSVKIFKSTGNIPSTCDIIKEEKGPDLFGLRNLPVSLCVSTNFSYSLQSAARTPEEALELAYAALERELSSLSEGTQLLRKDVTTTLTETSLILDCTVSCIEDIAVQYEFEITE